jgi:polyisoprenoid-binding protein YceI
MTTKQLRFIPMSLLSFFIVSSVAIQSQTLKINSKLSAMTIAGTTNVHDFESKVSQITGELVVSGKQIQSLDVNIPVHGIKSKEQLMDTKTYETFNATKNPNITFHLTEATGLSINEKDIQVAVTGNLTMNGTTRKISFKVIGKNTKSGVYDFKATVLLKMTDYKMNAPTAMMGMMKVGDGITLKMDITLEGPQIN